MTGVPELPEIAPVPAVTRRGQLAEVARSGHAAMSAGLLINGLSSYVFLAAAGRALGPSKFALISVLWAVLFLMGGGLFIPVEQELGRSIAARRARGAGAGALVRGVASVAATTFLAVAVVLAAFRSPIADQLFRGDERFVAALIFGIAGVGLTFGMRGLLAGSGRFYGFAVLFAADAFTQALPALALALAGVSSPIAYAAVLAAGVIASPLVPLTRGTRLGEAGPTPDRSLLLSSLGFLLLTSFLSAVTVNIGTIAVEILATPEESELAGVFLSGLVIARIPLFLFQAVQAVVLPRLSRLAAAGQMRDFRSSLRLLLLGLAGVSTVATVVSAVVGPIVVRIFFGDEFGLLGARDMGLLTLASMFVMCALTTNQAQIALHHQRQTGWPWGVAPIVFVVVAAVSGPDLYLRVELAMVAGAASVAAISGLLLIHELSAPDEHREDMPAL